MKSTILKYESAPRVYKIQSEYAPYEEVIDGLTISEHCQINAKYKHISSNLGDYHIAIETEVNSASEMQSKHFQIKGFISEIDRSWVFACGHPLNSEVTSYMGPYVDFPNGNIQGWKSNYLEAEKEANKGNAHVTLSFKRISHSTFSYWPLKIALSTRESYLKSSNPIKALVDLHYYSHLGGGSYTTFIFLAKSLEIVRALIPGKTDAQKEKTLPNDIRSIMKTSLHDIIGLANNRYEIRHIVKDKNSISLHDKMNHDEINAFKHDADLIIRFVVCNKLNLQMIVPKRG